VGFFLVSGRFAGWNGWASAVGDTRRSCETLQQTHTSRNSGLSRPPCNPRASSQARGINRPVPPVARLASPGTATPGPEMISEGPRRPPNQEQHHAAPPRRAVDFQPYCKPASRPGAPCSVELQSNDVEDHACAPPVRLSPSTLPAAHASQSALCAKFNPAALVLHRIFLPLGFNHSIEPSSLIWVGTHHDPAA
jgi:hypothetical protein